MSNKSSRPPRITPAARKRYIATGGVACPHCASYLIESGTLQADAGCAWADVTCLDCGREWRERYTLSSVTEDGA